jgi:[ribosomal protein S5]-alanine N-acetyltransferase
MNPERIGRHPSLPPAPLRLYGKRVVLRPLVAADFPEWTEVRVRNDAWLTKWEPQRLDHRHDPIRHRDAFAARCSHRERERQGGTAYGFGLFVDQSFAGEVNLNNVIRGAMQCATVGYWIDQARAGHRYVAEAVVVVARYAFRELRLHRLEINIVPRNRNSRRVMERLQIREEGVAQRFLEINGVWEDHLRFGFTAEEWAEREGELSAAWL